MPLFSVVTPTLQRQSLIRCCKSIDAQSNSSWEHIVMVDSDFVDEILLEQCSHPQRRFMVCGTHHGNFGNKCRHHAWEATTGLMLVHCDDDNYISDKDIFLDIATVLREVNFPDWAVFPIHRHGSIFFHDPPGLCMTDTLNIIAKRKIGRWPDIAAREADGHWVEALKINYPNYASFPHFRPIGVMEHSSNGV